ncbi:hypothetical protein [Anaerosinus massiliensis]|uniref:hypothetical protein n=1 Tax=Massilibacillus massiliensis TaxID=1806837 RepID=UPI000DA60722|nr:hypothetical protein [Massilibacillus massiliensis]
MQYFLFHSGAYARTLETEQLPEAVLTQKLLTKNQALELEDTYVILVDSQTEEPYPDIISRPAYLISNGVRMILGKYDRSLVFKAVPIIEQETGAQYLYWMMGVDEIDCLSDQTVYDKGGQIKEIVLDETKIGSKTIFKVRTRLGKYLIVRLDAAESLLRRPFYGISLTPVRTQQEEEEYDVIL